MSGTGPSTPAELHLGDSLAAFVDGELRDDARERVLSHLATCPQCKSAADEQRRLKNLIAAAGVPTLSAGLLARLQALPAGEDAVRGGPLGDGVLEAAVFGGRGEEFSFLSPSPALVAPAGVPTKGFRIHEVGRPSASRGRRFAFAAAGAFSMAALALGGALPVEAALDGGSRPDEPGSAITPLGAAAESSPVPPRPRTNGLLITAERRPELFGPPVPGMSPVALGRPLPPLLLLPTAGDAPLSMPGTSGLPGTVR